MSEKKHTPWSDGEIANLEQRQEADWLHPYTCICGHSLIPTMQGWECEECSYKQDWCYSSDANGDFPKQPPPASEESEDDKVNRLLESRHETMLEWHEPWPARCPQDKQINAHITLRATVHDCINLARVIWHDKGCEHLGKDRELLLEFMAVHWATIIEANQPAENGKEISDHE